MSINEEHRSPMLWIFACVILWLGFGPGHAAGDGQDLTIAIGDNPSIEFVSLLVAVEQARSRGCEITVSYLGSEDIAMEAVKAGIADIGIGTPYYEVQNSALPLRMFYQLSRLRFFPMVNKNYYGSWKDLAGSDVFTHSRGSGTEAVMNFMAARHGIEYGTMHYIPGSSVRAEAMLQGRIKVTVVDSGRRQLLLEKGNGQFMVLPTEGLDATDEALYATKTTLDNKARTIAILVEELLKVWRSVNIAQGSMTGLTQQIDLRGIFSNDEIDRITPHYQEAVANKTFPDNGGSVEDVRGDFEFFTAAGTVTGDPGSLKVENFWDFSPLQQAVEKLGRM